MSLSRRNFVKNLSITTAGLTVVSPFNSHAKAGDAKDNLAELIKKGKQRATDTMNDLSRKANGVKTSAEDYVA